MKVLIFCILTILIEYSCSRHTQKPDGEFQKLLQFYRSESRGTRVRSIESADSSEIPIPNLQTFNIDLSGPHSRDYMNDDYLAPFAEEVIVPVGSLDSKSEVDQSPSHDTPVKDSPTNLTSTTEHYQQALISSENPEEAENEATTMFTMDKVNIKPVKTEVNDELKDDEEDEVDDYEDSEEVCAEGETKKLKCNNACVCVDGSFFCSKKKCPEAGSKVTTAAPGNKTETNSVKKVWGNKKQNPNVVLPSCSSGMTKAIDCNACVCVQGRWACTKRGCIALTFREKASYTDGFSVYNQVETLYENKNIDEDCMEGSTRQMECNQCICHLNSWACSNVTCGPPPPTKRPQEIHEACTKEGDVKTRDCNLCRCIRGLYICTTNNCKIFDDKDSVPSYRTSQKNNSNLLQKN